MLFFLLCFSFFLFQIPNFKGFFFNSFLFLQTGECISEYKGHKGGINSLSYDPNKKVLYSGSDDKTIRAWDVEVTQNKNNREKQE